MLIIGAVPSESPEKLLMQFDSVKGYLERETGHKIKIFVPRDYKELIAAMDNGSVDIGLFGPFSYIVAASKQDIVPLIVRKRKKLGIYYNSILITRIDSTIKKIEDLKNRRVAFVNSASTSGFMIPQSLLISRNIDFKKFFSSYYFAGSHDVVIKDVLSGRADAGAASNSILIKLKKSKKIDSGKIKIIWKSDNIPGSPFVARRDLDKKTKKVFIDAMLNIHNKDPEALKNFDKTIEMYLPVGEGMYNSIRNIVNILGVEYIENNYL